METLPLELLSLLNLFLSDPRDIISLSSVNHKLAYICRNKYTFRNHLRQVGFKNSDVIIQRAPILFHPLEDGVNDWLILGRYAFWRHSLCNRFLEMKYFDPYEGNGEELAYLLIGSQLILFASDSDDVIFEEVETFRHLAKLRDESDNRVIRQISMVMLVHQSYHYLSSGRALPPYKYNTYYVPWSHTSLSLHCMRDASNNHENSNDSLLHTAELALRLFNHLATASNAPDHQKALLFPKTVLLGESLQPRKPNDLYSWYRSSLDIWRQGSGVQVLGYYSYLTDSRDDIEITEGPMRLSMKLGRRDNLIEGVGTDDHGVFRIEGSRVAESLEWEKIYDAGWSLTYYGLLLPWGIVGEWGPSEGDAGEDGYYPCGTFYLWLQ